MKNYLILLLIYGLFGCSTQKKVVSDDYFVEDKSVNLFAFVGKKISVIEFDPNAEKEEKTSIDSVTGEKIIDRSYIMDLGFKCKYLIQKNVFNRLETDTIDFIAYDHHGRPNFEKTEFVLLYVSKSQKGNYYFHRKYQFYYLERNSDGVFHGYIYTIKKSKKYIRYKNRRVASLETLFMEKKEEFFEDLFKKKQN
jgi:hypothetical protein